MTSDTNFMEAISKQFNDIKENFKYKITNIGLFFDEDIFSETIIKCNNNLSGKKYSYNDMLSYFWMAFKNNTLRELRYSRNKLTDELTIDVKEDITGTIDIDYEQISHMIIDEFGNELYELFALHTNGTSYEELSKISNINNIKYKFRCIRNYIRNKYKLE